MVNTHGANFEGHNVSDFYLVLLLLCRMSIDSKKKSKTSNDLILFEQCVFTRESKTEWHVKVAYNTEWIISC